MASMQNLYKINEIDPTKVITLPIKTPHQLAYIFKNTDVGLFPNRCEGGTNLMLMEYMACGKPVIATKKTGHADIVMDNNTFTIERYIPLQIREGNLSKYKGWVEPDVDEIVNHLETAYNNQERCKRKGQAAGELLSELTWQKAAAAFHKTAMELI
jgi:glycosyltransferase involved in cell wall biosynthesis